MSAQKNELVITRLPRRKGWYLCLDNGEVTSLARFTSKRSADFILRSGLQVGERKFDEAVRWLTDA